MLARQVIYLNHASSPSAATFDSRLVNSVKGKKGKNPGLHLKTCRTLWYLTHKYKFSSTTDLDIVPLLGESITTFHQDLEL
jgi:hypothetical protein